MNDSLELFLDTISNTFGGVLFIALLLLVLLSMSSPQETDTVPTESALQVKLQAKLSEAEDKMEQIKRSLELQAQQLRSLEAQADPTMKRKYLAMLAEMERETARFDELAKQKRQVTEAIKDQTRVDIEIKKQIEETEQQIQAVSSQAVRVRLPLFQRTEKIELPVLIRSGRLVLPFRFENGAIVGRNEIDASFDRTNKTVAPRPGAGFEITQGTALRDKIESLTDAYDSDRFYIALAVWPDSYEEADRLRNLLISLGYEFNLVLPPKNGVISLDKGQGGVQ